MPYQDIRNLPEFSNSTIIGIKAPPGTRLGLAWYITLPLRSTTLLLLKTYHIVNTAKVKDNEQKKKKKQAIWGKILEGIDALSTF